LASRLNDLARPSGIVIDGNFQRRILPADVREKFSEAAVYVRGIADEAPIPILYLTERVTLSPAALTPLATEQWETTTRQFTYRKLLKMATHYRITLPKRLKDAKKLRVTMTSPKRGMKGVLDIHDLTQHAVYNDAGAEPELTLPFAEARKRLAASHTSQSATVTFRIEFVARR
jgi:hypothetical protein